MTAFADVDFFHIVDYNSGESYDTGIIVEGSENYEKSFGIKNDTYDVYPFYEKDYLNGVFFDDYSDEIGGENTIGYSAADLINYYVIESDLFEDPSILLHQARFVWDGQNRILNAYLYTKDDDPEVPVAPQNYHEIHMSEAELLPKVSGEGEIEIGYDGMPVLVCSVCGQVHRNDSDAQAIWEKEVVSAIEEIKSFDEKWRTGKVKEGEPLTIKSSTFISFDKNTLTQLGTTARDITLIFKYNGGFYSTTIPAGTNCNSLADENGWAGFAYIMSLFGGQEISAEQFAM